MKRLTKTIILGIAAALAAPAFTASADAPAREHRAIWMTPFLSGNWPSGTITASNANQQKTILRNRLAKFRNQNVNIIYYHCRSMCDATYDSAYEPWAESVSGTRGVAPAFDPFGYLVEQAHENGIEVYAWVNPYRYCNKSKYGEGERNYENSHPDWLLSQSSQTILNPGLEEVKQRIVDVAVDIVTKYDVDGVVFDDYFYTNPTPMSLDADLYKKYTDAGGKLSQADWRRANVNEMVARVNEAIKKVKPYLVFGIGPAGVASPTNVESEYGLPAAPGGGDWQYNGIYSDPLAWYKAGSIDYMSPQIYWPSRFDALSKWWVDAAAKYHRGCYPSVDISDITTYKYEEFAREIEYYRSIAPVGGSGIVFFEYSKYINYAERWDGKTTNFGDILGQDVWNTKALTPLRLWTKSDAPEMVSNVASDGTTLTWDGNAAGRYAIYKQPKVQSSWGIILDGVSYKNSYALPEDAAEYEWFVAAYDRYAKTSAPLAVGAVKEANGSAPELVYPAPGENPVDLFEFKWNHSSHLSMYTVEVAEDAEFESVIGAINAHGQSASVTGLPTLTQGKTYYWRVSATDVNREHPVSAVSHFVAPRIAITSAKSDIPVNGTLTWSDAVEGADYTIEISRNADMSNLVHSATVKTTSYNIPARTLSTGRQYYARVTASVGEASSQSEIHAFTTENKNDYAAPTFVNPSKDGETLHVDQAITVTPWEGMSTIVVQIASDKSFPARTSYSYTLSDFATETPELGNIKISSKNLVDGSTYYVRARGSYNLTTSTAAQYTEYTPVYSFVYSSQAGATDLTADNEATFLDGTTLHVGTGVEKVTVYTVSGATVNVYTVVPGSTVDLSTLAPGAYLVKAGATTLKLVR